MESEPVAGEGWSGPVPGPEPEPGTWPAVRPAPSRPALLRAVEQADTEFAEAVLLLQACGVADCLAYPVGMIDRLLLLAHRAVLHRDLEAALACPECGVLNGLPFGFDDVPPYSPRTAWCAPGVGVREPTGADLLGLPEDGTEAAFELQARCTIGTHGAAWPGADGALERADQSLCGTVRIDCVGCGAEVSAFIDVQHLVTAAVANALADVDVEIHLIAARYGWDLDTIESLSDTRRARLAALAGSTA